MQSHSFRRSCGIESYCSAYRDDKNLIPDCLLTIHLFNIPPLLLSKIMSVGRLELPTNGLKGHCSTIELHAHHRFFIVARPTPSVNQTNLS